MTGQAFGPLRRPFPDQETLEHQKLLYVSRSDIDGDGVFAIIKIKKGTLIAIYDGERISHSEADIREAAYKKKGLKDLYLFAIDSQTIIDATNGVSLSSNAVENTCVPQLPCGLVYICVQSFSSSVNNIEVTLI